MDYGVPFTDEQAEMLAQANTLQKKEALIRKWRQEYKNASQVSNATIKSDAERIEELKAKILELDPRATFRNPSIKSLEERLQKLGGEKTENTNQDSNNKTQTDSDQGDSTDNVEGAE